jgi:hypothetical protein
MRRGTMNPMNFRTAKVHDVALAAALLIGVAGACGNSTIPGSLYNVTADAGPGSGSSGGTSGGASSGGCAAGICLGDATMPTPPQSLFFMPPLATVVIDGTAPQSASFTLVATDSSGHTSDVVADSVEFDRPDLATITPDEPVVATAPSQAALYGGTGTIHAIYHGKEATAQLTVQVHVTDYGAGLSATSPAVMSLSSTAFSNDPAPGISPLLYPYDQTVWPLGLTSPLLMWNAPQVNDVYHLQYSEKNYTFDGFYTLAALPAQMRLAQNAWDLITASNDAKNGSDPITFSLYRWDNVANTSYLTTTQTWTVAPESLQGAIYYWTASQIGTLRVGHISRFQPGTGATPQPLNNGICMGCHAVNAQGTVLVADIDDQVMDGTAGAMHTTPSVAPYDNWSGTRPWAAFDITQPTAPLTYQSNKFGADVALTPDGQFVVFGGPATPPGSKYFSLGNVMTGNVIATSGLDSVTGFSASETNLEMPAFSPDGTMLAMVESDSPGDRDNVLPNEPETIAYLTFNESGASGPTFAPMLHPVVDGTSSTFATTGGGLGYPSFTPDSTAIAFHAGHTSTGCTGNCDDTVVDDGNLFIVTLGISPADGGAAAPTDDGGADDGGANEAGGGEGGTTGAGVGTPIRLAAACDPPNPDDDNASVEPTFNPIPRGGYSWAVFTSMRAWGNQPWPSTVTQTGHVNGKRRLWLTPVDTAIGTTDPSHPAIYLEGQEDTPNMRGFFTLAACIATPPAGSSPDAGACTNGFNCCSGFCENGVCVDVNKVACSGLGGPCATAGDCCNSNAVNCTSGTCSAIVQ